MLVIEQGAVDRPDLQGAYFDGSLELLRELAVTIDLDTALPRLSAIVRKMLPHDALRMACFDQRGQLVVNASTAEVPDMTTSEGEDVIEDVIIDDLRTRTPGASTAPHATERVVGAGYRSVLGVSTRAPEPLMRVAFWSKQQAAFNRTQLPLARRIAYHFGLAASRGEPATVTHRIDDERAQRVDAGVQRGVERLKAGTHLRGVGESAEWRDVLRKASQVAPTDTTVLITGESGTGKEIVARFIHAASARKTGPLVALNCAALPEQLLESELFGYERGAFTSAQHAKPGQVELAAGGVLFLDEVSEMSLSAQAKFLRLLQEREFQRLGGTRLLKANIRVIAATNGDLRKAVERGDFREDLFYRLGVFDIQIPPLRERPSDIVPLAESFLQEISRSLGRPSAGLTRDARNALTGYDWPGNVRELRNALERAAILSEGALIDANHLALQSGVRRFREGTTDLSLVERTTIAKVLQDCRGNKTKAARPLGLTRTQLHLRIRKYGLEEAATAQWRSSAARA
jgi:transcriptional regulator with GAF, ATPase, and Fis domain